MQTCVTSLSLSLSLNALPSLFPFASPLFWLWVQSNATWSALSSLVHWMGAATLQSLHCGLPINESDMKRGCGALYCEDQLLVLCKERYPSDHVGFHDSQYGCEIILYLSFIVWRSHKCVPCCWHHLTKYQVLLSFDMKVYFVTLRGMCSLFQNLILCAEHLWHIIQYLRNNLISCNRSNLP